jgi:hypothetical protein
MTSSGTWEAQSWLPRGRWSLRLCLMYGHRRYTCYRLTMTNAFRIQMIISELKKWRTDISAQPFPSSSTEVMRDSHSTGFDSRTPLLPRRTLGVPEARAARKAPLRWRRRRTERVTRMPRIVTNKARITMVRCQSADVAQVLQRRELTRKDIYWAVHCQSL